MKTLSEWFEEYSLSHQNKTNKMLHFIFVPLIYFSVVGLIMSIPSELLEPLSTVHSIMGNWAFLILAFALVFYFRLSVRMGFVMLLFSSICLVGNYIISQYVAIGWFSLVMFVVGWTAQFYGHKIEGKKPSFLKDLQFLLIGPAWVIYSMFHGE